MEYDIFRKIEGICVCILGGILVFSICGAYIYVCILAFLNFGVLIGVGLSLFSLVILSIFICSLFDDRVGFGG